MSARFSRNRTILNFCLIAIFAIVGVWGCSGDSSTPDIAHSGNAAPVIRSVSASPSVVSRGGSSRIAVFADDRDGDELTYTYQVHAGEIIANGSSATWTAPEFEGKFIITVTASDGHRTVEAYISLTVFAPMTMLTGTLGLPFGQDGNLGQISVILRPGATGFDQDQMTRYANVTGSGRQASFSFEDVLPGRYFLEAWRDVDQNGRVTAGDYYGRFSSASNNPLLDPPLTISEGETRYVHIQMSTLRSDNLDDVGDADDQRDGDPRDNDPIVKGGDGTSSDYNYDFDR